MGFRRAFAGLALSAALAGGAASVRSSPPEPLVVTKLPDPDPDYTATSAAKRGAMGGPDEQEDAPLDPSMQDFGRAIGQATQLQEQAIEARCKAGQPSGGNSLDRLTWAANCMYQRY